MHVQRQFQNDGRRQSQSCISWSYKLFLCHTEIAISISQHLKVSESFSRIFLGKFLLMPLYVSTRPLLTNCKIIAKQDLDSFHRAKFIAMSQYPVPQKVSTWIFKAQELHVPVQCRGDGRGRARGSWQRQGCSPPASAGQASGGSAPVELGRLVIYQCIWVTT